MKATTQKPVLFIFLLGTLTFTLSALPKIATYEAGTRSMSSLETGEERRDTATPQSDDSASEDEDGGCNFQDRINSSAAGNTRCNVSARVENSVNVVGSVKVKKATKHYYDHSKHNADLGLKDVWAVDIKLETDCATCYAGRKEMTIHRVFQESDFENLNSLITQLIDKNANKLAKPEVAAQAKAKEILAKNERIAKCEEGTDLQRATCNVEKMKTLSDAEAAQLFTDKVHDQLAALMKSDNKNDRAKGKALLAMVNKNGAGGDIVKDEAKLLDHVADNKDKAQAIREAMDSLPANDPRRFALMQEAQQYEMGSTSFFNQMAQYNQQFPFSATSYATMFGADLTSFQAQLNTSYQALMAQAMLNAQQQYSVNPNLQRQGAVPGQTNLAFNNVNGTFNGVNQMGVMPTNSLGGTPMFPGAPMANTTAVNGSALPPVYKH